jgi:hypothetical protein
MIQTIRMLTLAILYTCASAHAMEPEIQKPDLGRQLIANIQNGNEDLVARQLAQGVNVNAADKDGITALMYAVSFGREGICNMLIDAKADLNKADIDDITALHIAARRSLEMCRLLINAGAKLNPVSRMRLCSNWAGAPENGYEGIPLAGAVINTTSNPDPICEFLVEKMLSANKAQKESMLAFMISLKCKGAMISGIYTKDIRQLLCASLCVAIKEHNIAKTLADIKKLPACRPYQRERINNLLIKYFPHETILE